MQNNNLPKNMGKKIADALKQQDNLSENTDTLEIESDSDSVENTINYQESNETFDTSFDLGSDNVQDSTEYNPVFSVDVDEIDKTSDMKLSIDSEEDEAAEEFEMPNNINVLKRLINQLPTGVPRQTGAQIIRQTIEALGIPMKSVLQDAQRVRDCLNSSIKDCNYTIQEYKTNIRNLEKQSANYQKQLNKLNDIIGLFVYNDRK
ncbi:TPA: hypothetical protein IAA86_00165 [Candidatus Galligastranaerophilus intestinavium]|uniref:Uncharacterized protein n=1 Tax=Candidatus Galligastranaerophilus intestinavium TaxID=2840836 RepID=A0A9D1JWH4_9BACT|nr:hypothetical protein [Candidatus Galligastranaerophilus intestinavium]